MLVIIIIVMSKDIIIPTKSKISTIILCIIMLGAESLLAIDLTSSWEAYRNLYKKPKAMLATEEEKGAEETEAYEQALTNLIPTLENLDVRVPVGTNTIFNGILCD